MIARRRLTFGLSGIEERKAERLAKRTPAAIALLTRQRRAREIHQTPRNGARHFWPAKHAPCIVCYYTKRELGLEKPVGA